MCGSDVVVGDVGYGSRNHDGGESTGVGVSTVAAVYRGWGCIVEWRVLEQSIPQFGRCDMARGGRPKREARKSKKTPPSAVNFSPVMVATPAVEVIKKKRKSRDEDF